MSKVIALKIEGMTCGHCEMSVTKELAKLPGAQDVKVSSQTGTASLSVDESVDQAEIQAAVEEAGYKLS
ncbi:MAG: copper chaperone [Micrococcales bacterium]|nr:copper chaperone [Actinomycetota bacterium]NCA08048.1 copper chaperone [Micrococcales bacterium]